MAPSVSGRVGIMEVHKSGPASGLDSGTMTQRSDPLSTSDCNTPYFPEDDLDNERLRQAKIEGRLHSQFESLPRLLPQWFGAAEQAIEMGIEGFHRGWDARETRKEEYRRYLQSQTWQAKRQQVMARCNHVCERCHTTNVPIEAHHMRYEKRGQESLDNLLGLCSACHAEVHRDEG